jgi:hypothetical protein
MALFSLFTSFYPDANNRRNMAFGGENTLAACATINEHAFISAHQVLKEGQIIGANQVVVTDG